MFCLTKSEHWTGILFYKAQNNYAPNASTYSDLFNTLQA